MRGGNTSDLWVLPPDGNAAPFFTAEGFETFATFSPDGAWLLYVVEREGIYVRPYPGPEPATLISEDGQAPAWSSDGRQIYYSQGGGLMAVDVTPGDQFEVSRARPLIERWQSAGSVFRSYDVFPDGSFVTGAHLISDFESFIKVNGATELHVVVNWFEELKARVPN